MNKFLSKNFQKDICISKCTFLCMPASSILKAAGKPASPSHSVETHTLSLHIRHTENDLSQTQKETIPERQVQPRLHSDLLRPSLFLYTSRPGFPGKRSCPSSIRQKTSVQPNTTPVREREEGLQTTTPPLLPLSSCVSFYASSVSLLQACPLSRLPVPGQ